MKKILFLTLIFGIFSINISYSMALESSNPKNDCYKIYHDADFFDEMSFESDILPEIREIEDLLDNGFHHVAFLKIDSIISEISWFSYDDLEVVLKSLIVLVRKYQFYRTFALNIFLEVLKEDSVIENKALKCLMFFLIQKGCDKLYPIAFEIIKKELLTDGLEDLAPILYALVFMEYKSAVEFYEENIVDDADNEYIVETYWKAVSSFYLENKMRTLIRTDYSSGSLV